VSLLCLAVSSSQVLLSVTQFASVCFISFHAAMPPVVLLFHQKIQAISGYVYFHSFCTLFSLPSAEVFLVTCLKHLNTCTILYLTSFFANSPYMRPRMFASCDKAPGAKSDPELKKHLSTQTVWSPFQKTLAECKLTIVAFGKNKTFTSSHLTWSHLPINLEV
jgi:hypothetical protein